MPLHTLIDSVGLVLDIAGAILLWRFGLPESLSRKGHIYLIAESTDEREVAKAKSYDRWARLALVLLVLGFLGQLISNFI